MQSVTTAVIPVAGVGTRFLPATKALPKELLPLIDKPVIQYIVEEAKAAGIKRVIFILNEDKAAIRQHFSHDADLETFLQQKNKLKELEDVRAISEGIEFVYIPQLEPKGLGHAVLQAKTLVADEPFIVFGGDDIVESKTPAAQQLMETYATYKQSVIGVLEVAADAVDRYGIIDPAEEVAPGTVRVRDVIEKPAVEKAPSRLGVVGRWLLTPEIFAHLERVTPDQTGEIQLTAGIQSLMKEQQVYAHCFDGQYWDCGNKIEYIKAVISFASRHPKFGTTIQEYIRQFHS